MNILQLCKKFPYPVHDGETLAMHALSRSLAQAGADVRLLAMNTARHYYRAEPGEAPPAPLRHYREWRMVDVDNRITLSGALANVFSRESYHIVRFQSAAYQQALAGWLQAQPFDATILETLYLAPYIPALRRYSKARIIMRAHNVESEIWERVAQNLPLGPKKLYLEYLTRKLRRFEQQMLGQYDLLAAITERDLEQFRAMGFRGRGVVLPVGIDLALYPEDASSFSRPLSLGFIGSLDWAPNIEGIRWFLKSVWPTLWQAFPQLTLHIAGRNTPEWMFKTGWPGVQIHGEVEDAKAFMQQHSILLAPILSGGGMRVKILEGMALGRTVLSTRLGLEGIQATDRQEALLAETPEDFVAQIRFALETPQALAEIGARARALVAREFDQQVLAQRLLKEIV